MLGEYSPRGAASCSGSYQRSLIHWSVRGFGSVQPKKEGDMKRSHALSVALAALLASAGSAFAGTAYITGDGFDFYMDSGNLPGTAGSASHFLSGPELRGLHQSLNAAGISTDGVVTFVLANTDAGLSLFALVDNNNVAGGNAIDAVLGMTSTTVASAGYVMNDLGVDIAGYSTDGSTQTLFGDYFWHPDGGADGMAWTGLQMGDTGTFDFSAILGEQNQDGPAGAGNNSTFAGLAASDTFQFITWNGSAWQSIMNGSFNEVGMFSFAFAIVPLPPALALGLAGLGIVAVARKRRTKKA